MFSWSFCVVWGDKVHKFKSVWRPFTLQLLLSDQLGTSNPTGAPARHLGSPLTLPAPQPLPPTYQPPPEWFLPTSICLISLESIPFSPELPPGSDTLSLILASEVLLASGLTSKPVFPQEWNLILPLLCFLWPQDGESSPQPGPGPDLSRPPSSPLLFFPLPGNLPCVSLGTSRFPQGPRSLTPPAFMQLICASPATLVLARITSSWKPHLSLQPGVGPSPVFSWQIVVSLILPLAQ